MTNPPPDPAEPAPAAPEIRRAAIHGAIAIGFALATLVVAGMSAGGLRTLLFAVAPVVMFIGAVTMLIRTYRVWKANGRWQIWQGAAWFLLSVFLVMLFSVAPILLNR